MMEVSQVINAGRTVTVKGQPKNSKDALWTDLQPGHTSFAYLSQIGVMEGMTQQGKSAAALRLETENGNTIIASLPLDQLRDLVNLASALERGFTQPRRPVPVASTPPGSPPPAVPS